MITAEFAQKCRLTAIKILEFKTYKEFYEFYRDNQHKGIFLNVYDDGKTG